MSAGHMQFEALPNGEGGVEEGGRGGPLFLSRHLPSSCVCKLHNNPHSNCSHTHCLDFERLGLPEPASISAPPPPPRPTHADATPWRSRHVCNHELQNAPWAAFGVSFVWKGFVAGLSTEGVQNTPLCLGGQGRVGV